MQKHNTLSPRPAFVEAFPHLRQAHNSAMRAMYGAAAGVLGREAIADRDGMIWAVNAFLGICVESRRELTIHEMEAFTVAIEAGAFRDEWELSGVLSSQTDESGEIHLFFRTPAESVRVEEIEVETEFAPEEDASTPAPEMMTADPTAPAPRVPHIERRLEQLCTQKSLFVSLLCDETAPLDVSHARQIEMWIQENAREAAYLCD